MPIALMVFGFGFQLEIAVVAFAAILAGPDPDALGDRGDRAAAPRGRRARCASASARVLKIVVPAVLPRVFVALRLAAGVAVYRRGDGRDRGQPARPRLRHHDRRAKPPAGAHARPADLDRLGRLGSQFALLAAERSLFGLARRRRGRHESVAASIGWRLRQPRRRRSPGTAVASDRRPRLISPVFLPGPDKAWASLVDGLTEGGLLAKLLATVAAHALWLAARLAARHRDRRHDRHVAAARAYLGPTLEFLRPLPASAIIPLAIAFFGLSDGMVLGWSASARLWPMLLATMHGFAAVEPRLYEVSARLGHVAPGRRLQDRFAERAAGHPRRHAARPYDRADPGGRRRDADRQDGLGTIDFAARRDRSTPQISLPASFCSACSAI